MESIFHTIYAIGGVLLIVSLIIDPYILFILYTRYKRDTKIKQIVNDTDNQKTNYINTIDKMEETHRLEIENLRNQYQEDANSIHYTDLSYETVNTIVDDTFAEIWTNKYFMTYTLKEMSVIPDMDDEIQAMTEDVYNALGPNVKHNLLKYYDLEYFIKKITRRTTVTFMDYIKTYKPPSK